MLLQQWVSIFRPVWTSLDPFLIWCSILVVWQKVKPWLTACSTPVLHGPCTIQLSDNKGIAYLDLHGPHWITSSTGRDTIFQAMMLGNQLDDNRACMGCGCKWSCDSWLVTQLSDMVNIPSNTPTTVRYHIDTCMDLTGSLPQLVEIPFSRSIRNQWWQLSMYGVWLVVNPWLMTCATAVRYG